MPDKSDDFESLPGIGAVTATKIRRMGVKTFAALQVGITSGKVGVPKPEETLAALDGILGAAGAEGAEGAPADPATAPPAAHEGFAVTVPLRAYGSAISCVPVTKPGRCHVAALVEQHAPHEITARASVEVAQGPLDLAGRPDDLFAVTPHAAKIPFGAVGKKYLIDCGVVEIAAPYLYLRTSVFGAGDAFSGTVTVILTGEAGFRPPAA